MKLHLWGTDFRRTPSELRAKLFCQPEARERMLRLALDAGLTDLVYLHTCNRVEFYTTAPDYFKDTRPAWLGLLERWGLGPDVYYQGYHLEGKAALRHLCRVACSLESLVIGEPQILGQLKEALRFSLENGIPVDPSLERCFQVAFETAKKVRSQTALGEKPVSVATLGLQHLVRLESTRPLEKVVVVGRGPISVLVAQWLSKERPGVPVTWVNRTLKSLDAIGESRGVARLSLEQFLKAPPEFSHLFTATSSPEPIFGDAFFSKLKNRPLVFDFAEPADVDTPAAGDRAELIHLEDLKEEANANAGARARAVSEAEILIESAVKEYCLAQKEAPLLKDFSRIESSLLEELSALLAEMQPQVPQELFPKVERWAEKLSRRQLHLSREHLKELLRHVTDPDDTRDFW